jgi:hypothetical protein
LVFGSFKGEYNAEEGSKVLVVSLDELLDICEDESNNVTTKLATFVAGFGIALMSVERHFSVNKMED